MLDFIGRIKVEKQELDNKLQALESFLSTETFSSLVQEAKELLNEQFIHMKNYSRVLEARLNLLEK